MFSKSLAPLRIVEEVHESEMYPSVIRIASTIEENGRLPIYHEVGQDLELTTLSNELSSCLRL